MTEQIKTIIDATTKRKRCVHSVYVEDRIKTRLNQNVKSHVVYEGDENDDLEAIRKKLQHADDANLQIRGNRIFEIRRRLTKLELIQKTIKETIEIMDEKEFIDSDKSIDEISKIVFNKFLGGSEGKKYKIKTR